MVKRWRVKGFTLVEMIIGVSIVSLLGLTMTTLIKPLHYRIAYQQITNALYAQSLSLINDQISEVSKIDGCWFDQWFYYPGGTVNQANTYDCTNGQLIVHLGSGNISYESIH